jgi:hypothetical protein
MSSTAMGLAGTNIDIVPRPEITSTPKTLNVWLQNNEGYQDNSLIEVS